MAVAAARHPNQIQTRRFALHIQHLGLGRARANHHRLCNTAPVRLCTTTLPRSPAPNRNPTDTRPNDGFGLITRPVSLPVSSTGSVAAAGGGGGDLVSYTAYDAFGREPRQFLPYVPGNTNGAFVSGDLSAAITSYHQGLGPDKTGNAFMNLLHLTGDFF